MAASPTPAAPDPVAAPFDPDRLRALGCDLAGCEREVTLELLLSLPWLMQEVTRAVVLRDATHLATHARELRRCCHNLGAAPLAGACAPLEHMGERGDFRGARLQLEVTQQEHARLQRALADHLTELRSRAA